MRVGLVVVAVVIVVDVVDVLRLGGVELEEPPVPADDGAVDADVEERPNSC